MRKRILFITTKYPWPLVSGDRVRAHHFLKTLSKDFDIDLLVFEQPPEGNEVHDVPVREVIYIAISPFEKRRDLITGILRGLPIQVAYYTHRKVMRKVVELIGSYDMLFCHLARTAEYGRSVSIPKMLDYSDSFSLLYAPHQRPQGFWGRFSLLEYPRMKRYEKDSAAQFDVCLVSSKRDAQWLEHHSGVPQKKLYIVPNGVSEKTCWQERVSPAYPSIIFSGNMNYYPNVDAIVFFVKKIFPDILESVPNVHLTIAGAYPAKEVRALANEHITVTGYVDDLLSFIARSTIAIAPLRIASGIQNKILEALALGVPVVASPAAADGLGQLPEQGSGIVVSAFEDMAQTIIQLLRDGALREQLANEAKGLIQKKYTWDAVGGYLHDIMTKHALL